MWVYGEHVHEAEPVAVIDKPTVPLNVRAKEVYKNYIVVTWDVPQSDGGAPITGYKVSS